MNWNNLETFVILSETLNFSQTARILNTAQPVVSRKIRLLEEQLGYALFIRTRKKVTMSAEGQELKRRLNPLVEEIQRLFLEKGEGDHSKALSIRMGSIFEAGQIMMYPRLAKILEKTPQLNIHTTFLSSATINNDLLNGLLDFGFVHSLSEHKTLRSFPVIGDTPVMIADKKTSQRWRDLEKITVVGYREQDLYARKFVERNFSKAEQKKLVYISSIGSHAKMIDLARRLKALAIIPKSSAQPFLDLGQIEVLLQDKKAENLYLVCHEQTLIDKRKKAFLENLLRVFKEHT